MDTLQPVENMTNEEVLSAFGTSETVADQGFDGATQARVCAVELVRARQRLAHYRTLYATFLEAGKPYMIENLDESGNGHAVPAKLVFSDDFAHVAELEMSGTVAIWTELELLRMLTQERTVQEFFADLLDELMPQVAESAQSTRSAEPIRDSFK